MSGEQHQFRFLGDEYLPSGKLWAICRTEEQTVLYVAASVRKMSDENAAIVLEHAWAALRELAAIHRQRSLDHDALTDPSTEVQVVNVY